MSQYTDLDNIYSGSNVSFSGDLSGTSSSQTVIGLYNNPLSNTAPTSGQVLAWNGTYWIPTNAGSGSFSAGGDLSGTDINQIVIGLRTKALSSSLSSIGSSEDGYALVWNDGYGEWQASQVSVDLSAYVLKTTTISAGSGLTGGGDLSTNVTLSVSFGSSAGSVCEGNDSRLSDSRPPNGSASGDLADNYPNPSVVKLRGKDLHVDLATIGASQDGYALVWNNASSAWNYSDISVDLSGYVLNTRTISAGTGLTGGGDLSANVTLSVDFGTTGTTVCVGNDSRLSDSRPPNGLAGGDLSSSYPNPSVVKIQGVNVNSTAPSDGQVLTYDNDDGYWKPANIPSVDLTPYALKSTTISAGTGLTGGGDLSANRTLSVDFGNTATTVCVGNDSRLSDSRTPSGSASGDLSGNYPNPSVTKINGKDLNANVGTVGASEDGYVLTWNNADTTWKAKPATGGSGVTTVGTIDSQSKSSNGLVISGTSIVAQTAEASYPGLVSTTTQTFAGAKTFTSALTAGSSSGINTFTGGLITSVVEINGNVTVQDGYYLMLVNTSASRTITLPSSPAAGRTIIIKDYVGTAETYPITLARAGSEKIENVSANRTLSANYGSYKFVADASGNWWQVD